MCRSSSSSSSVEYSFSYQMVKPKPRSCEIALHTYFFFKKKKLQRKVKLMDLFVDFSLVIFYFLGGWIISPKKTLVTVAKRVEIFHLFTYFAKKKKRDRFERERERENLFNLTTTTWYFFYYSPLLVCIKRDLSQIVKKKVLFY